jgi:uncharacterized protein involved in exopolysaccharide biosynthesis
LAQAVLTRFVDEYLAAHVRINRTAGAYQFLAEQTARLRGQLTASEDELRSIQQGTGIAEPQQQQQILIARVGQLEGESMETEVAFATSLAQARLLQTSLNGLEQLQVIGRTVGMDHAVADGVRQQLYDLQLSEQNLLAKYTSDHVEVKRIRRQIAGVQALLTRGDAAATRLDSTHTPREPLDAANSLLVRSDAELVSREPALLSLQIKGQQLRDQLLAAKQDLNNFQRAQLQITRLQREISLQDTAYRKYADSLERATIDHSLEKERISNINVVQPATYNPKPISPRVLLNFAIGFGFAVVGGLALVFLAELSDPTLKTPRDIEERLGVPNLVTIPVLRADQLKLNGRTSLR